MESKVANGVNGTLGRRISHRRSRTLELGKQNISRQKRDMGTGTVSHWSNFSENGTFNLSPRPTALLAFIFGGDIIDNENRYLS